MSVPKVSVLVVEDVDSMRQLLDVALREIDGFAVSGLARNGAEARLELTRRFPDLVLLDEILPGESGAELLGELRGLGLPVVLLTGLENRPNELPPGAFARVLKPSWKNLAEDRKRIEKILRQTWAACGKSTIDDSGPD